MPKRRKASGRVKKRSNRGILIFLLIIIGIASLIYFYQNNGSSQKISGTLSPGKSFCRTQRDRVMCYPNGGCSVSTKTICKGTVVSQWVSGASSGDAACRGCYPIRPQ